MIKRILTIALITTGVLLTYTETSPAQNRPRPPKKTKPAPVKQPVLNKNQSSKAVAQLRSARNALNARQKFSSQKHASASLSLQRARSTERALKDVFDRVSVDAVRRIRPGHKLSSQQVAQINQSVKSARQNHRAAVTRRANAELTVSQTRSELTVARKQTSVANKRLSLAKKGDWISAHNVMGARPPVPKARTITIGKTTFSGDGLPRLRKGSLRNRSS